MTLGKYRPDIDGLRAVSILAVVLYHAHVPGFEAGYLGVDVFFVISGFLITGQLLREAELTGTLNLANFYARRVRRLAPAFVAMAGGTTLLAFLCLSPLVEQGDFGGALSRSAVFYYNIAVWRGAYDYGAPDAQQQVLMHTWSLGVEEQFYLVWPWICLAAVRIGRPLLAFSALVLLSFAGAGWTLPGDPGAVFFLLPFRVWELGLGACVAVRPWEISTRGASALTLGGGGLVGYALLSGQPLASSLGPPAVAVAGSALISAFGPVSNPVSAILRSPPLVHLGRVSYAWYLWHWPLLVMARLIAVVEDWRAEALAIAVSFVAAELTYFGLERTSRRIHIQKPVQFLTFGVGAMVALVLLGQVLEARSRRLRAQPENAALLSRFKRPARACERNALTLGCDLGATSTQGPSLLLWGDSYAQAISPALAEYSMSTGRAVRLLFESSCPPLLGVVPGMPGRTSTMNSECQQSLRLVREELPRHRSLIRGVVLAASWSGYRERGLPDAPLSMFFDETGREIEGAGAMSRGLGATLDLIESIGARVLIVGVPPRLPFAVPNCLFRSPDRCTVDRTWNEPARNAAADGIRQVIEGRPEVRFVELFDLLCPGARCGAGTLEAPLFADRSHISGFAARNLVLPALVPHLDWLGAARSAPSRLAP